MPTNNTQLKLTSKQILDKVATGELSSEDASKLLEAAAGEKRKLHYKVSPKGAISFYGLRRMPITLYIEEIEKIVGLICADSEWSGEFGSFLESEGDRVKRKSE